MRTDSRPRRAPFFAGALVSAAAFVGVYVFFVRTRLGQIVDERALAGAENWPAGLEGSAEQLLEVLPTIATVAAAILVIVIVLVRRNGRVALAAASAALAANVSTQVLKAALDRPDNGVSDALVNSLPSGHTTAAAAASLAVFLVSSPRLRPVVAALGALFTTATGAATLLNQWHRPSDVVAAMAVVAFWGSAVGFVLAGVRLRDGVRARPGLAPLAWITIGCAVLGALGLGVTVAGATTGDSHLLIAYAGGVATIAAVAFLLAWLGAAAFRRLP